MRHSKNNQKTEINYLTADNGCTIIDTSSEIKRGPASNILSPNPNALWVTENKLPQECTVSLRKLHRRPDVFNTIGFYCWHQYDSNPALVELYLKINEKWVLMSKIRLELSDNWQYFRINEVQADKIKELRLKIIENFGDSKTYLNEIGLFYTEPKTESKENEVSEDEIIDAKATKPNFSREKKHYSHHKESENLNYVIQELKEANERIVELTKEQSQMNKKIEEQKNIIVKIHQFMKVIVEKMGTMQSEQEINERENDSRKKSRSIADYEIHNFKKDNSIYSKEERERCNKQLQQLKDMLNSPSSHELSYPPKEAKEKKIYDSLSKNQTYQKKSVQKNSQMRDVIRTESEDELSDYSGQKYKTSQTENNRNSKKGNKALMLERLKELIEEKEKKKIELKLSAAKGYSKSKSKWNSVYDEEASDYENYDKKYY